MAPSWAKQISLYGVGQVLAYGLDLGIFTGLVAVSFAPVAANVAGKIVAFIFAFVFHHYFSFRGHDNRDFASMAIRYGGILLLNAAATSVVLHLLIEMAHAPEIPAKVFADISFFAVSFLLLRAFVFSRRPDA